MSDSSSTFLGLLAGTAIGATLGILFAPDKGVNTRRKINDTVLDARDTMAGEAYHLRDRVTEEAQHLRNRVADTVAQKKHTIDDRLEQLVSDVSYKTEDVITKLESKLQELKEKNKQLQKG